MSDQHREDVVLITNYDSETNISERFQPVKRLVAANQRKNSAAVLGVPHTGFFLPNADSAERQRESFELKMIVAG